MGFNVKITYIYHSSFFVEFPKFNFLFDLPNEAHLPKEGIEVLHRCINKKPLLVFFSHSHADHFNENIEKIISPFFSNYKFIVSYDIYSNYAPRFSKNTYVLEPEDEIDIDGIDVKSFESNDLGNSYLISFNGIKIYFGGDLAEWIWPDMREKEREFVINYFKEILNELKGEKIDIGFSNVDPRLKNFGGGIKFLEVVQPQIFVPMHTFGKYDHLKMIKESHVPLNTKLFIYSKIGDTLETELDV